MSDRGSWPGQQGAFPEGEIRLPPPPPPPPPPHRRPRRTRWVVGAIILALALVAIGRMSEKTRVTRPRSGPISPPSSIRATAGPFRVSLSWKASSDSGIESYRVYRGATLLEPNYVGTSFVDDDVLPGETYSYAVHASSSDGDVSVPVRVTVSTPVPSVNAARVSGLFSIKLREESHFGFATFRPDLGAEWELTPRCATGRCDVAWKYLNYPGIGAELVLKNNTYRGDAKGDLGASCGGASALSVDTVKMHVDEAGVIDDEWRATQIVGSVVERSPSQLGCVGTGVRYSFTGSLLPDYADAVVRVENDACGFEGSGFIVDGRLVVTNAHVVAGDNHPAILERGRLIGAEVVAFESKEDIAVLLVHGLSGGSLSTAPDQVDRGTAVLVLGYPGQSLSAADATIRKVVGYGFNIFNRSVRLDGYVFRGFEGGAGPGSSGGPMVLPTGEVVGIVVGGNRNLGLAIASTELAPILRHVRNERMPVATGGCLHY